MKCLAIIPARGGSKRIPKKNIKDFLGKPIIAYSIETALESGLFSDVIVSTDDEEIAAISKKYGANIPFYRSQKNSDDYATLADVIFEVLEFYKQHQTNYELICCILPTAPFLTSHNLVLALNDLNSFSADSVFSVSEFPCSVFRSFSQDEFGFLKFNFEEYFQTRSQDLKKDYYDAGQFYFFKVDSFYKWKRIVCGKIRPFILNSKVVQDIDSEEDWRQAESKFDIWAKKKLLLSDQLK